MTDAAPGSQELSSTYDQLCTSYRAIDDFLSHERMHVQAEIEEYAEAAPFRKGS